MYLFVFITRLCRINSILFSAALENHGTASDQIAISDTEKEIIVGLNVALKRPFPLVGESKLSRESKMSRFGLFSSFFSFLLTCFISFQLCSTAYIKQ